MDTTGSAPASHDPYVARTPEDVLATVPLVLGFEPEDSVVMLTFGAARTFHARVNMPVEADDVHHVCESLVGPAVLHGVRSVLLVGYHSDARATGEVVRTVAEDLLDVDIEVIACLRAHAGRWWPIGEEWSPVEGGPGTPYDAVGHRFRARAVSEGRVTLRDRAAVEASVAPAPGTPTEEVLRVLATCPPWSPEHLDDRLDDLLTSGRRPDDGEVAALLTTLASGPRRDRVTGRLVRHAANAHVALWSEVVRRAPERHVADVASVLALAAWLAGDGALAWCALDRVAATGAEHPLGSLVAGLLHAAVPPHEWESWVRPLAG